MSFIKRIPLPMSALALALATLGNLLASYSPQLRLACGAAAGVLVVLLLARIGLDFRGVREDLVNPAVLAVTPAFPMALMVLATYIKPVAGTAAFGLWLAALALQFGLIALFAMRHLFAFSIERVLPSWFLVFVGFVVASVTSPAFAMEPLGRILLYAGLAGYGIALALLVYRLVKVGDLPGPALPSIAILMAPPSLCLAGYLALAEMKQPAVVYALLAAAAVSLVYVLARLPKVLASPFHPGFAALTFPFVITALALKLSAGYFAKSGAGVAIPPLAVQAFEVLALAMVLYVLARYAVFLTVPAKD